MSKRRKAKSKPRTPSPAIHKFAGRRDARAARGGKEEAPRSAVHKFAGRVPAVGNARLAAMAAASAEVADEPEVEVRSKSPSGPKGGVDWKDVAEAADGAEAGDAGEATMARPAPVPAAPVAEGVQVVAKGASKFTAADLELLRASIKVKGSGLVMDGINLDELKWDAESLIPVVAQDRRTGAVLMLGHMSRDTLERSLRGKSMVYWNRATGKEIVHSPESGRSQRLVRMGVDCDKDALLAIVEQEGAACHRDTGTCFADGRSIPAAGFLGELDQIVRERAKHPQEGSRTNALLAEPLAALKAFVDQANTVTKSVQGKGEDLAGATAELLYHLLVALRAKGVGLDQVLTELHAQHLAAELAKGSKA